MEVDYSRYGKKHWLTTQASHALARALTLEDNSYAEYEVNSICFEQGTTSEYKIDYWLSKHKQLKSEAAAKLCAMELVHRKIVALGGKV